MRIAIFGIKTLPARAGADRAVEHVLAHLPEEHACTVYLLRERGPTLECTANRHYVYVPALGGKHLRPFSYFLLCTLHFLVKGEADVGHVHNADFGLFCPLLKLKRLPLVGTFQGDPYVRDKWGRFAKAFLRLSEWVFVRACDVLTSVSTLKRVRGRSLLFVPNGIEPYRKVAFPRGAVPVEEGSFVLFACGRLDRTKGLHHLLAAYRELPEAGPLLAIGDFSHDAAYSRLVEEEAAKDSRVVLHRGLFPREQLLGLIQGSAVFVFPSEWEAMSVILLEAIACRKVVVCSDIEANTAVAGEDYPFLFRSEDPGSLGEALGRVLTDPEGAEQAVRPRFDELASQLSWERTAAEYDRLYRSLSHTATRR